MSPTLFHDDYLPQDTAEDDSSIEANTSQPVSEAEIEELLYGGERSTGERLQALRALREDLASRRGNDFGDGDPGAVVREIDDRIAELEGGEAEGDATGRVDADPLAHRETLAPDSDELLDLDAAERASLDEDDDFGDEDDEDEEDEDALGEDEEDEDDLDADGDDDEGLVDNDDEEED